MFMTVPPSVGEVEEATMQEDEECKAVADHSDVEKSSNDPIADNLPVPDEVEPAAPSIVSACITGSTTSISELIITQKRCCIPTMTPKPPAVVSGKVVKEFIKANLSSDRVDPGCERCQNGFKSLIFVCGRPHPDAQCKKFKNEAQSCFLVSRWAKAAKTCVSKTSRPLLKRP